MSTTTPSKLELLRLLFAERSDPAPYYEALAAKTITDLPFEVARKHVLDLGCGTGHNTRELQRRGATVVGLDLSPSRPSSETPIVAADALRLPFAPSSFDVVLSSNMLEHTPSATTVLEELERVLRPGGTAWISFTNWYSPWGGHNITPFHYLGAERGLAVWSRLFGRPDRNIPGIGLFPTHIGETLDLIDRWPTFELQDAYPRYYPSQRWLLGVPKLREVLTWNCVLVLRRLARVRA